MTRESRIDAIVRARLAGLLKRCRARGIEYVTASPKRPGGVVSVVKSAWREQVGEGT